MRLSALGTAQVWSAPTNGEVDTPAPLPYELLPVDGCAAEVDDAPVEALVEVTVVGACAGSTGTFGEPLSDCTTLDVELPVVALCAVALVVVELEDE
jgi:hypothetical protein